MVCRNALMTSQYQRVEIVTSKYVLSRLIAFSQVHVIPHGVDVDMFSPDVPPFPLKTKSGFKFLFNRFVLLITRTFTAISGLMTRKGVDIVLEAYQREFSPTVCDAH